MKNQGRAENMGGKVSLFEKVVREGPIQKVISIT